MPSVAARRVVKRRAKGVAVDEVMGRVYLTWLELFFLFRLTHESE